MCYMYGCCELWWWCEHWLANEPVNHCGASRPENLVELRLSDSHASAIKTKTRVWTTYLLHVPDAAAACACVIRLDCLQTASGATSTSRLQLQTHSQCDVKWVLWDQRAHENTDIKLIFAKKQKDISRRRAHYWYMGVAGMKFSVTLTGVWH